MNFFENSTKISRRGLEILQIIKGPLWLHLCLLFAHPNPAHLSSSTASFTSSIWIPIRLILWDTNITSFRHGQAWVIIPDLPFHIKVKLSESVHINQHVLNMLAQYQVFLLTNLVSELYVFRILLHLQATLPSLCLWATYFSMPQLPHLLNGNNYINFKVFCLCLNGIAHEEYLAFVTS